MRFRAIGSPQKSVFQKLPFRCSEKERIDTLALLDSMNINHRTLFPDIDGSVKQAMNSLLIVKSAPVTGTSLSFTRPKPNR